MFRHLFDAKNVFHRLHNQIWVCKDVVNPWEVVLHKPKAFSTMLTYKFLSLGINCNVVNVRFFHKCHIYLLGVDSQKSSNKPLMPRFGCSVSFHNYQNWWFPCPQIFHKYHNLSALIWCLKGCLQYSKWVENVFGQLAQSWSQYRCTHLMLIRFSTIFKINRCFNSSTYLMLYNRLSNEFF